MKKPKRNKTANSRIDPFDKNAAAYDRWYDENPEVLALELSTVRFLLDQAKEDYRTKGCRHEIQGLEVGVGTGRFGMALGIRTGIDPAPAMLEMASSRGMEVFAGVAENLPFEDGQFDYTAFFTSICFLEDPLNAFLEANRVTRKGGFLICSFLNRDSGMGRQLADHKEKDLFYCGATFFSGAEVLRLLEMAGYHSFSVREAVFMEPTASREHEGGLGHGLYGVVLAWKKEEGMK